MKTLDLLVAKLKQKGIEQAEIIIVKAYEAVQETLPEVIASEDASQVEKTVAGVLIPVVAGFKGAVEKLADLNKDGKVG